MRCHILPFAKPGAKIRLMYEDEASFGRISDPSYCWCPIGVRPIVPRQRVREYLYAYGAVDPIDGEKSFIIAPNCNTAWTNEFLKVLSDDFKDDYILLCWDSASWHKSQSLEMPDNIYVHYLPTYTPETNPVEQLWKVPRKDGFKNTLFNSLDDVQDKLSESLMSITNDVVKSICGRKWIVSMFN